MYGQRDDILADSRRPGGASPHIRLTDNTYVLLRWSGFADSSKEVETSIHAGGEFGVPTGEPTSASQSHHKTELAARAEDRRRP